MIENALPKELADELLYTFPESNSFKHGCVSTKQWELFSDVNINLAKETFETLEKIFDTPKSTFEDYELNLNIYGGSSIELIRDWHIDGNTKKFQSVYYLGGSAGGEFELKGGDDILTYPYQHNRLIVWYNTKETQHRFWSVNGTRYTISMPLYDSLSHIHPAT